MRCSTLCPSDLLTLCARDGHAVKGELQRDKLVLEGPTDKNQLKLDRRLCGVGGKTLDYLRQLLSKLNSPKVPEMMYDDVVPLRFIQTHSGSCKSPHSN